MSGDENTKSCTELIDGLPPRQREIIRLRLVVGLSALETAERLGMAPAAVRLAQHNALARLRRAVDERPDR
jgi:RNA polymerase sigma-70 factor, ECF subfamily